MSLLVVGSVAYDAVETPVAKIDKALGGSATFFSAAASYFSPVNLVAVVGQDFDHAEIDFLKTRNVDLTGLTTEPGKTFFWSGKYLDNMNDRETLDTQLNVFADFNPVLPDSYKNTDFVFLANIQPDLQYNVVQQIDKPKFVAMDTMNFWITGTLDSLKNTLKVVDALVINDSEVQLLSGESNIFKGAKIIQDMGPKTLVIKKGEHGAILVHNDDYFVCPAIPVIDLFDPTGAGDTFAGGFMGYLASVGTVDFKTLCEAMITGTALASFCVEKFSMDATKNLTKRDIQNRIAKLMSLTQIDQNNEWFKA